VDFPQSFGGIVSFVGDFKIWLVFQQSPQSLPQQDVVMH
jgi:hypothetical protein